MLLRLSSKTTKLHCNSYIVSHAIKDGAFARRDLLQRLDLMTVAMTLFWLMELALLLCVSKHDSGVSSVILCILY